MAKRLQITTASSYNPDNLVFLDPVQGSLPGGTISFQRVNIKVKYPDGNIGDLIIPTEQLFSIGVKESIAPGSDKVNGYTLPLSLYNRDGPSDAEKQWVSIFKQIEKQCKEHVLKNRVKLGKKGLEMAELKKFTSSSFWWKTDDDDVPDPQGPVLYPKLIISRKDGNEVVKSDFYDLDTGASLNPMLLIKKYCYARAAIKIESIFIGSKISLQVKLWEVGMSMLDRGIQRLLVPKPTSVVSTPPVSAPVMPVIKEEVIEEVEEDYSEGSISESESEPEPEPEPVKKTRKKMVARK